MSLINEALKRAEAEKAANADIKDAAALPPPVPGPPRRGKGPALAAIFTAVTIIAAVVGGASLLQRFNGTPKTSIAASVPSEHPMQAKTAIAEKPNASIDSGLAATSSTKLAQAADARARLTPTGEQDAQVNTAASKDQVDESEAAAEKAPALDQPPAQAPAEPTAKAESPSSQPAETGGFKLSGIMSGPEGDAALINGQIVEVGKTVGGAKLVRILNQAVELQVGDRRFILKM